MSKQATTGNASRHGCCTRTLVAKIDYLSCKAHSMLSAEELRLWDHVRSINVDQSVGTNQRVARTRPLLEDDLVTVIAELQESTAATQKQIDLLQRHREQRLQETSERLPHGSSRMSGDSVGRIGRKDALALQQLRLALGEARDALASSLQSASEEALQTKKATARRLAQLLHDDDQKIKALQKLALPCDAVHGTEIDSNQRTSRLVSKLVDFTCKEAKFRLDRIYLEQLHEHVDHENDFEEAASTQEVPLKSDLDTLYAEIPDVVAMSVSQELEEPLRNSRLEDSWCQRTSQNLASQCIRRTLSQSSQFLEDATNDLEFLNSYLASLHAIHARYNSNNPNTEPRPGDESLLAFVENGPIVYGDAALGALLLYIGLSTDGSVNSRSLEHELSRKMTKEIHRPGFNTVVDDSTSNILDINDASSQLLSSSSLGYLGNASTAKCHASLGALDNEIALLKGNVEDLDLSQLTEPSKAQNHFLDRWT